MKYRVRKRCQLLYPDGTLRGERGYVVDGGDWKERRTLEEQAGVVERIPDRQTPASPRDLDRLTSSAPVEEAEPITLILICEDEEPAKEKAKEKPRPKKKKKRKGILRRKKVEDDK